MPVTTPETTPAELEAFSGALADFMRALRRAQGRAARADADGELTLSQYQVLDPLDCADGPLPVSEVAEGAGVSPPTATRMLDALERDGFVERRRVDGDRRVVHVSLTGAGREAVRAKRASSARKRRAVLESLSPGERKQAARVLTALADAIEQLR